MQKELLALETKHCIGWREYRIGDLFDSTNGDFDIQASHINGKGDLVVSSGETNTGVIGRTDVKAKIFDANTITIDMFGSAFYRSFPYKMVTHARVFSLRPKNFDLSNLIGNYFVSVFNYLKKLFDYSNMASFNKIKDLTITLPVTNNEIAFAYIEEFLATLDAERLATLDAYLTATNLKDYTLTEEERQVLAGIEKVEWGEFRFSELFNNIQQGARLKKADQIDGDIPFVMAGATNTGIVKCISNPVRSFPKNSLTIDIFGNTFYRDYDFGAGDDTGVFWNDDNKFDKYQMLFLTAQINKSLAGKYDFGHKLRASQTDNFKIQLPITSANTPDYAFMSLYIQAMQKAVIKNVAEWLGKRIAATGEIIRNV